MNFRGISLGLVLVVCVATAAHERSPQQLARNSPILITIRVANTTFKVGSAIRADMSTTNNSQKPIVVGRGSWESGRLEVRDSQGKEPLTELEQCIRKDAQCNTTTNPRGPCPPGDYNCQLIMRLPLRGGPSFLLDPGKTYSESVEVNAEVYDVTRPGNYTIQWQGYSPSSKTVLKSNAIALTLIP
jgi:hypothetical protein